MDKREEIREEVAIKFFKWLQPSGSRDFYDKKVPEVVRVSYRKRVDELLIVLDSMGVVIKAQGYFPEKDAGQDNIQYCAGWYDCFHKAIDTGYEATERLIKE